jgi:hypothetical protein
MQRNSVYPPDGSRPTNSLKSSLQEAKDVRAAAKGLVRFARMIGEIYDGRRGESKEGGASADNGCIVIACVQERDGVAVSSKRVYEEEAGEKRCCMAMRRGVVVDTRVW